MLFFVHIPEWTVFVRMHRLIAKYLKCKQPGTAQVEAAPTA